MPDSETLSHTKWDCKYHVVFIPKYRRKALYHELRHHLGDVFRALAAQKECRLEEGHLMADHVHRPTVSPLTIPLAYCHINSFQRASSVEQPLPGGEKRKEGRASPHHSS